MVGHLRFKDSLHLGLHEFLHERLVVLRKLAIDASLSLEFFVSIVFFTLNCFALDHLYVVERFFMMPRSIADDHKRKFHNTI